VNSLYAGWLEAALHGPLPDEPEASCAHCPQIEPDAAIRFGPKTKCCTYLPIVPNFLVGRVLDVPSVRERIARGVSVTPLGLGRSPAFTLLYEGGDSVFGRAESLRCPHHLDDGGCGIWAARNATCATWFCRHVRGAVGLRLWRAVHRLMDAVEQELARWCVAEIDPGEDALTALFPPPAPGDGLRPPRPTAAEVDGRAEKDRQAELWGDWLGREADFYAEASRRVSILEWKDVLKICGPSVTIAARLARDAYLAHGDWDVPVGELRVGPLNVLKLDAEKARVTTYSMYDPIDLPVEMLDQLRADPSALPEPMRRKLLDFQVLIED
jgi:hypothetical protein